MTTTIKDVRPSPLAGTWYPADAQALRQMVDGFLAQAKPAAPEGRIIGLLAPHAGLRYSGLVAGYAFKLVGDLQPEVIAILCPYHRPPYQLYDSPFATTAHAAYETPLGIVPVDRETLHTLAEIVPLAAVRGDQEHAIEIELPFLQRALPHPFTILPIMIIHQTEELIEQLGHALARILKDRRALLVASSDLSHFFPQQTAQRFDQATLAHVRNFDPRGVLQEGGQPGEGACGRGAIAAVMWAARDLGADSASILHYATSGDTAGDYRQVVGYGAGVFFAREN